MSTNAQPTGNDPVGTEGNTPPATPTPNDPPVAPVDPSKIIPPEGYELIKTEDKKNLISARDKANNKNSESDMVLNALVQKDAVRDAMRTPEFKKEYPDVTMDEILELNPGSDEDIIKIAKAKQERFDKVKLDAVKKVQEKTRVPEISAQDRDQKLNALRKPSSKSRFAEALRIKRMKVK